MTQYDTERKMLDEQMLAALRNQMIVPPTVSQPAYPPTNLLGRTAPSPSNSYK